MTRPIEIITKELAAAMERQQASRHQNVYGIYGDELAKILEDGARLTANIYSLIAEKESWSKTTAISQPKGQE